jgi:hypothetical protein
MKKKPFQDLIGSGNHIHAFDFGFIPHLSLLVTIDLTMSLSFSVVLLLTADAKF